MLVLTTIQMMLDYPGLEPGDFASPTDFRSPLALLADLLERACRVLPTGVVQLYGMTETCGAVTYLPREDMSLENPHALWPASGPKCEIRS